MAIKGLTDRDAPRFPRIGFLRKGGPKRKNANGKEIMGLDLEYFRFDSDDAEANAAFVEVYGEKPKQVNVFFPWPTVDQNFQAWKEAYTASALQHRCDGETCVLWLGPDGEYHTDPKPCPGGCKEIGYLSVIIPELGRMAYVTVLTHSINDIMELQSNLEAYELLGGQLRGVPFVLRRIERRISTPDGRGGRARRSKWLMHLETKPEWTRLKLAGMQMDAIPANVRAALPAPAEAKYIIEGYATDKRMAEIDAMSAEEASAMLRANVAKQRGPNWEHFEGFGDEPDGVTEGKFTEQPKPAPQPTNGAQPQDPPGFSVWADWSRPDHAIAWGMAQGVFDHQRHAENAYAKVKTASNPTNARAMWAAWYLDVQRRIAERDAGSNDKPADPDGWEEIDANGVELPQFN